MSTNDGKILRLHMPQWQGGNVPEKTSLTSCIAWTPVEGAIIDTLGLRRAGSDALAETSALNNRPEGSINPASSRDLKPPPSGDGAFTTGF
jgi:hypothetical protein